MADVDFSDFESAKAWFKTQTTEMRCMMSSRAALRVAANLRREDADLEKRLVLSCFWTLLTSAGRGLGRPADVEVLKGAAYSAAQSAAAASAHSAAASAYSAAASALSAALSAAHSAAHSASGYGPDSAAESAAQSVAFSAAESAVLQDSQFTTEELLRRPVWGDTELPESIAQAHPDFLTYLGSDPNWQFFHRWYAQMWDGTFKDWHLAIEVATLDPNLWEGKDALAKVAEAIRGIEARRALAGAISDFQESSEIVPEDDVRVHRGHNNPPELIDEPPLVARREIVWAAIDDLEREVESETPDKGLVSRSLDVITLWLRDVLAYLGRKSDLTIDQVIKWGVPIGGTYLMTNPAKLQQIIEAGKTWLPFLP